METKTLLNERRSVNHFDQSRSIDEALLKEIIHMAVLAPSGFSLQPWRIIAVKSTEGKKRLQELSYNQGEVSEASVMTICPGYFDASQKLPPCRPRSPHRLYEEMTTVA